MPNTIIRKSLTHYRPGISYKCCWALTRNEPIIVWTTPATSLLTQWVQYWGPPPYHGTMVWCYDGMMVVRYHHVTDVGVCAEHSDLRPGVCNINYHVIEINKMLGLSFMVQLQTWFWPLMVIAIFLFLPGGSHISLSVTNNWGVKVCRLSQVVHVKSGHETLMLSQRKHHLLW